MCRNIKKLRRAESAPSEEEIRDAALQFVRKVSGYRVPAQRNARAFEHAVRGVTREVRKMFEDLSREKNLQ